MLAAIIHGDEGHKLTYDTSPLSLGNLMEWLRTRLGVSSQGLAPQQATVTPVLDMDSSTSPVSGVNWLMDFLCRGSLHESDPRNEPANLCAYAYAVFYKKANGHEMKETAKSRLPRAEFSSPHPQCGTHGLIRYSIPRVPELYGRIPKMPADWKGNHPREMLEPDYKDEGHCNWAIYVLALFYPVTMDSRIELPPADNLYISVQQWWRAKIIGPTGECRPAEPTRSPALAHPLDFLAQYLIHLVYVRTQASAGKREYCRTCRMLTGEIGRVMRSRSRCRTSTKPAPRP